MPPFMTRYSLNQKWCIIQLVVTFKAYSQPLKCVSFSFLTPPVFWMQVFKCLPVDSVHNMRELKEYTVEERLCDTDPEQAIEELKAVRGLLVYFPLKFLCEENLLPPLATKEGMAPVGLWT